MADIVVSVPDEVVDQVVPILTQLVEKVGGTIAPAEAPPEMGGPGQPAYSARANRPTNLNPPVPSAGPAPVM